MVRTFSRPLSQQQDPNRVEPVRKPGLDLLEKDEVKTKRPSMWNIVLYNDDYTPMDFVEFVLKTVFHISTLDALALTLAVSRSEKSGRSETRHIGSLVIGPAQAGTNPGKGTRSSNPDSSSGESSANRTSSIKPRMQPWRKRRFTRARAAQAWAEARRLNGALLAQTQRHRERPSLVDLPQSELGSFRGYRHRLRSRYDG